MTTNEPRVSSDRSWASLLHPGAAVDILRDPPGPLVAPFDAWSGAGRANGWWFAEASRAVYRFGDRHAVWARGGFVERGRFDAVGLHAVLVVRSAEPACAILVYRGTVGLRNWAFNLNWRLRPWDGPGCVHVGFRRAWQATWSAVRRAVPAVDGLPLIVTGHSLGGAQALLAAAALVADGVPPAAVWTFGSPRIGDDDLARTLAEVPVRRVERPRDVVPRLPPRRLGKHVSIGTRLVPLPWGGLAVDPGDALLQRARRETPRRWSFDAREPSWWPPVPWWLADHVPVNYSSGWAADAMPSAESNTCATRSAGVGS